MLRFVSDWCFYMNRFEKWLRFFVLCFLGWKLFCFWFVIELSYIWCCLILFLCYIKMIVWIFCWRCVILKWICCEKLLFVRLVLRLFDIFFVLLVVLKVWLLVRCRFLVKWNWFMNNCWWFLNWCWWWILFFNMFWKLLRELLVKWLFNKRG